MADVRWYDTSGKVIRSLADEEGRLKVSGLERTEMFNSPMVKVPLVTGSVYTAGDAMGLPFTIPAPKTGIVLSAQAWDTDDETIAYYLLLYKNTVQNVIGDHDPFALGAEDYTNFIGAILIDTFMTIGADTLGSETNINLPYATDGNGLVAVVVTSGTPNYAAGESLRITLGIWSREIPEGIVN